MKHFILFLLLFPICFSLSAQIRFELYFAFDESTLSQIEQNRLDSLIQANPDIAQLELKGHTDERGSNDYNIELSRKRMESVRAYLHKLGIEDTLIETAYFGESMPRFTNENEAGRQKNRRVEISIFHKQKEEVIEIKEALPIVPNLPEKVKDEIALLGDTVLRVDGGAEVLISKKEFEKYKDCLEINFIENGAEALEQGLSTLSSDGTPLISCGMIEIKLSGKCEGECFEAGLKVRLPFPEEDCPRCEIGGFYNFLANGTWEFNPNKEVNEVEVEGKKFYELIVDCPMKVNCDCKDETWLDSKDLVKIKWPRKYRMQRINILFDNPPANYRFSRWKKNKARGAISCKLPEEEALVYLQFKDKYGNLLIGEKIPLSDLRHSRRKVCKWGKERKGFLFFKRYTGSFYARYKLSKKLFKEISKS